jgi:4-hydroxybenzoate polyprenyltransferase
MINCYADYELDAVYKTHLSNAVYELGKKNIFRQMIATGIIALLLTVYLAISTHQLYLIPLTIAGGFIGLQYSVGPFHFKSRGPWQLLCLWGIIFFGPMLYISIVIQGFPSPLLLTLFAAYGFHQMGIIMLNTAEDFTEDRQAGLHTVIVALGLHRSMHFARGLIGVSGLVLQGVFIGLCRQYGIPLYGFAIVLVFTAAWIYILAGFSRIIRKIRDKDEVKATEDLKKNGMKVPEWLKLAAYSSLLVTLVLFLYGLFIHR